MSKFWVSWYSGYYKDEGCTDPPFQVWITGQAERVNRGLSSEEQVVYQRLLDTDEDAAEEYLDQHSRNDATICALITAESEEEIWPVVAKHFPDYRYRFCESKPESSVLGDRFLGFKNKTSLYG